MRRVMTRAGLITSCWLFVWATCFVLTHIPISPEAQVPLGQGDKVIHFAFYFTITLLGGHRLKHLRQRGGSASSASIWRWAIVYLCWAILDEWTQRFVGRTPSIADFLADATGVLVASFWVRRSLHRAELSDPAHPTIDKNG